MAGFTTYDQLKTSFSDAKIETFTYECLGLTGYPANFTAYVGTWYQNVRPIPGADPAGTPGTTYSNTSGGIIFANSSEYKFLYDCSALSAQTAASSVQILDRLVGVGAIAINSTGNKTINSAALSRYTSGESVMVLLEIQTAGTTTSPIVSLSSYTNSAGDTTRAGATITFPANNYPKGGLVGPMPLQAGDTGVRSVETINVATAGGGSAAVNVILVKFISTIQMDGGRARWGDKLGPTPFTNLPRIYDGATLMLTTRNTSNSTTPFFGHVSVIRG
jgi:hypothetical protein